MIMITIDLLEWYYEKGQKKTLRPIRKMSMMMVMITITSNDVAGF